MTQDSEILARLERRNKPRIKCNYPAMVRGDDGSGRKFEEAARVVDLSVSGIFVILNHSVQNGADLSVKIAFPTGALASGESRLAINGTVVRSEPHADGKFGLGIRFQNYHFR